jgi:hypothetical protein
VRPAFYSHEENPWYHSLREEVYKTSLFCTKSGNVFAFVSMILRSEFGTVLMNFLFANFRNTKLVTPFTVKKDKNTLHYTYLDTIGRPVIVAHKK